MPELMAFINSPTACTIERMFRGALECAYSKLVMLAKISANAVRTYEPDWIQTLSGASGHFLSVPGILPDGYMPHSPRS